MCRLFRGHRSYIVYKSFESPFYLLRELIFYRSSECVYKVVCSISLRFTRVLQVVVIGTPSTFNFGMILWDVWVVLPTLFFNTVMVSDHSHTFST